MPAAAQYAAALAGGPAHQGSTCHHREAITHGPHGDPPNAAGPDALRNALCCVCMAWPGAGFKDSVTRSCVGFSKPLALLESRLIISASCAYNYGRCIQPR